jgi:hypothetical protein
MFDEQIVGFVGFGPVHLEPCINHPFLKDKNANIGEIYTISIGFRIGYRFLPRLSY